ncbi:MAG: hypothetical protein DSY42_00640 [Aquifex sp.]|nr:MAG: hypothetical protein DSY42_00640 [Aquifex sp.]
MDEMLINVESNKDFDQVVQAVQEKSKEKGFGVMSVHEVHKILESKGMPINYKCTIVEICQPKAASTVLSKRAEISTAMPCRISVYEQNGKVVLSTIAPTELLNMYNAEEFKELAKEIEDTIKTIMEEAAK